MELSEKKGKMLKVIKDYDYKLRKENDSYVRYFDPEIPDKIMNILVCKYDNCLLFNHVIAFYDTTILTSSKAGFIFMTDGIYHRTMGKTRYFAYRDMTNFTLSGGYLIIDLHNADISEYKINEPFFDLEIFKNLLGLLKSIDIYHGSTCYKSSGIVKSVNLPKNAMLKCNGIIHTAAAACGGVGAGLAQIPFADNTVIVPIQIGMIVSLGEVFDLNITESTAKSILASASATVAGRSASQAIVGWIPGAGNIINCATAASLTEAIGWIAVRNFISRRSEDMNKGRLDAMKAGYAMASDEYEEKLNKQAEEFLTQQKEFQKERDEYEKLLNEYELYIEELEEKHAAAEKVSKAKNVYNRLLKLSA